jgi:phosphatidylserine/phosphatidylglycerophosphate/cardiolipin synthase-like enzyme
MIGVLFPGVGGPTLLNLAEALSVGRLAWPPSIVSLEARGYAAAADVLFAGLTVLAVAFPAASSAAAALGMLGAERKAQEQASARRVDLVWSGPEGSAESRDTGLVVRELFADARHKVVISAYNLGAPSLFAPLVENKRRNPDLVVLLFVSITVDLMKSWMRAGEGPVVAFRRRFAAEYWPDAPLPTVYCDPRPLADPRGPRLHAKCVVIDDETAFVGSANFSEAAHGANIEASVIVRDARFARSLSQQFEGLVAQQKLERVI